MKIDIDDDRLTLIKELNETADRCIANKEYDKAKQAFNQMRNMATTAVLTGIAKANKREQG